MPIVPSLFGLWPYILPVLLLSCSNIFMTFAWYGNLKFKAWTMVFAILVSWGIARWTGKAKKAEAEVEDLDRRFNEAARFGQ